MAICLSRCSLALMNVNKLICSIFSSPEPKAQVSYCDHALSVRRPSHTLLPAIATTVAIGTTENKQVRRKMGMYFEKLFMLFSLTFGS